MKQISPDVTVAIKNAFTLYLLSWQGGKKEHKPRLNVKVEDIVVVESNKYELQINVSRPAGITDVYFLRAIYQEEGVDFEEIEYEIARNKRVRSANSNTLDHEPGTLSIVKLAVLVKVARLTSTPADTLEIIPNRPAAKANDSHGLIWDTSGSITGVVSVRYTRKLMFIPISRTYSVRLSFRDGQIVSWEPISQ